MTKLGTHGQTITFLELLSEPKTEPDVGVSWLVIIEHMESVTGALLVVNVSVLDAMCLKIIFLNFDAKETFH